MDPLSVAASVVGLLGATAKIYGLLEGIASVKNSPTTIRDAQIEVRHVEIALRSLQRYLWRLELASAHRKELIFIDEVIVCLADSMMALSDFESLLEMLKTFARVRISISWFKYSKQVEEQVVKLQRQKTSLSMMLNILQWYSIRLNQQLPKRD